MDSQQMESFEQLQTIQERAKFLLDIGVTAKVDVEELDLTYRAFVGDIGLPITACSKDIAILKGTDWLKQKAEDREGEQ